MDNTILPFIQKLSVNLMLLFLINFLFIFPPIFKFIIIPRIEKRVGEKLQYKMDIYKWQIFSKYFGPPFEIGHVITIKYLIWKIKKRLPGKIWGFNPKSNFALVCMNYDIRQASKFEIIMSFLVTLNMWIFGLILITHLIFPKYV